MNELIGTCLYAQIFYIIYFTHDILLFFLVYFSLSQNKTIDLEAVTKSNQDTLATQIL